jgi:hypothetical protein
MYHIQIMMLEGIYNIKKKRKQDDGDNYRISIKR